LDPKTLNCENLLKEFSDCYTYSLDLLQKIKDSSDIEKNKENAKIILNMIKFDDTMTQKE